MRNAIQYLRHSIILYWLLLLISCSKPIPLEPLSSEATVVAFGDSLTYGTGTSRETSYPSVLQQLTGLKIINEGVPGNTTEDGINRIAQVLEKHNPQLVILCLGGNDFLRKNPIESTRSNLIQIIETIQQSGSQVMMIAVPELGILINDSDIYTQIAKQMQIPLLEDVLSTYLSDRTLKSDTIHLNKQGYHKLAESVKAFLVARGALTE